MAMFLARSDIRPPVFMRSSEYLFVYSFIHDRIVADLPELFLGYNDYNPGGDQAQAGRSLISHPPAPTCA